MSQALGPGDDSDADADEDHLGDARAQVDAAMQPGDEARDRDVQEAGGRKGQRVGQRPIAWRRPK